MRKARVVTASVLGDAARQTLIQRFEKLLGDEKLEFEFEIDESLIGGFKAFVDGKLYDMSVLTRLQSAQRQIGDQLHGPQSGEADVSESGIGEHLRRQLQSVETKGSVCDYGRVLSCADGVVEIEGLNRVLSGELLEFENNAFGMALELSSDGVGAVLFSGANEVYAGSIVRGVGRVLEVGVGNELLGRIVDPLGRPLDDMPVSYKRYRAIEYPAPTIMDRAAVTQPLETGILAIDSMIPVGKGQRELIIGDRQMGKSSIAMSALLNQSRKGVVCVYCAIGQKASSIVAFAEMMRAHGALDNCVIVASTASDSAAMQYVTPYAGCAIAEYFMYAGRDVLIVYDDLSKHAIAYRAMSLLLKRPPGREAYPGDVFYLHSRLLERAAKLSDELGGGSMTALPIVETMAGDISAYIPTNVISITDGQIYLESELFHSGVRPAVNVGLSVSRVGRAAQSPAMKSVSGQLRLKLAQYREMAVFSRFDSDIDSSTQRLLDSGDRLTELLKQDQTTIYNLSEQVILLFSYEAGLFDSVSVRDIGARRQSFLAFMRDEESALMDTIDRTGEISGSEAALQKAVERFCRLNDAEPDEEGATA